MKIRITNKKSSKINVVSIFLTKQIFSIFAIADKKRFNFKVAFLVLFIFNFSCSEKPKNIIHKGIQSPMGTAFCNNKIYIAQSDAAVVGIFNNQDKFIKNVTGFLQPMDLACHNNHIFVADFGADKIFRLDSSGRILSSFGNRGKNQAEFNAPTGIAVFQNYIYVAEFYNHRIQKLTLDGKFISFIGKKGHKDGELFYPTDVFLDEAGLLYVADAYNHRIQVFNPGGTLVKIYDSKKYGFKVPSGVVKNAKGIYIADSENHRVILISNNEKMKILWKAPKTKSFSPTRLDFDTQGQLIIIDTANNRILRLLSSPFFKFEQSYK